MVPDTSVAEIKRSTIWQKNLAINLVMGFFLLLMLLYLLMLGLLIDKIIAEVRPGSDPVTVFSNALIYYFGIELLLRFFLQSLPKLNIETYLHLPVRKSLIVHYVSAKSIVAIGNYLPLLITIPFALKVIAPEGGMGAAWLYIVYIFLFQATNNFLATWLKRQMVGKPGILGIFALLLLGAGLADYFSLFSLSEVSASFFSAVLAKPLMILVPAALIGVTYTLNYTFLRARLYPEEVKVNRKEKTDSLSNIRYLKSLGLTGEMISLELKLMWRHKRTRTIVYMTPFFLLYGFFFYPQEEYMKFNSSLIFVGVLVSGAIMLNYLNYCFSYESNYFDAVITKYHDFERYIRVKYLVAVTISSVCYILTIPYAFFGTKVLFIDTVTFLYNIGFLSFILLYMATYSKKRMDLTSGGAFNYQGLSATHWLAMVPAFILPVLIYLPFSAFRAYMAGLILIGALGLFGLLFSRSAIRMITKQFVMRKHIMAEGFRE